MRLECFTGFEEERWLVSGTTTTAAAAVEWIARIIGTQAVAKNQDEYSILDQLPFTSLKPSGLLFLPYLAGERSPIWDANAKGELLGITQRHTRLDLLQGVLEGVCFTLKSILNITEQLTKRRLEIVSVAGAATSYKAWMQILANVLNRNLSIPTESETTALGAAALAAVGVEIAPSVTRATQRFQHVKRVVVPQKKPARAYEAAYELFAKASKAYVLRT
jgi:xylulokinase